MKRKLYFCDFENFGDALSPYLMRHLLKCDIASATPANADIMGVGSIFFEGEYFFFDRKKTISKEMLKWLWYKIKGLWQKPLIVWGSAFLVEPKIPKKCLHYRKLDIRAVRGGMTKALLEQAGYKMSENVVLGDPGLLYSDLIDYKRITKKFEIGIVPNYDDTKYGTVVCDALQKAGYRVRVIDVMQQDPINVLREIAECDKIIASAMHAMIVSDAMGIPNVLINFPNYNEWKVNDYYSAFGMRLPKGIDYKALLHNPREEITKVPQKPYIKSSDIAIVKEKLQQVLLSRLSRMNGL